tara:strand:+ start:184 stop:384 length:201 start_codon:yes stop_codon:yes gene_type:complete
LGKYQKKGASSYLEDDNGNRILDERGEPIIKPNINNWISRKDSLFVPIRNAKFFPKEFYKKEIKPS